MDTLNRASRRPISANAQGGYVLLLTLITLVVLLFGALFTMRGTLLQTIMAGNTAQRQKNVQSSDMALRLMQQQIITVSQAQGDVPLEIAATTANAPWFFVPAGSTPWPLPGNANGASANYWSVCGPKNAAAPCWPIPNMPAGYQALAVVVPTNLPVSDSACLDAGQRVATYYNIFIHTAEANGKTAVNTSTIFRLCTPNSQSS